MVGDRVGTLFPFLLLASLAGLTFWLDQAVQLPTATNGLAKRHDPDYFVDGLSALKMDPHGRVAYTLAADKMVHYPDDDTTRLTNPRWVSLGGGKAPVTITAQQALVSSNGENVYFEDNVRVVRDPSGNQSRLVLETTFLHVIPDQDIARTDRPVKITDANTVVNAVGLELNSETRVLKLLSNVKGVYYESGVPADTPAAR
ncbi:MAG: LPS export ABC transporter periplasmic protein LptC [Rhodospirillaceae bacterium]